jgi:hypothetical protein
MKLPQSLVIKNVSTYHQYVSVASEHARLELSPTTFLPPILLYYAGTTPLQLRSLTLAWPRTGLQDKAHKPSSDRRK